LAPDFLDIPYSHSRLILSTGWQCYYIDPNVPQQAERGIRMAKQMRYHNELGPAMYDNRTNLLTFWLDGVMQDFNSWIKAVNIDPEYEVFLRLHYLH
jgi:hypothetical protein